jgi:hypothetical protein
MDLCSGVFRGSYLGLPYGEVSFALNRDRFGNLMVTAYFRGAAYYGNALCQQNDPWQAQIEFYFPNTPIHRGLIGIENNYVVIRGHQDGGYAYVAGRPL